MGIGKILKGGLTGGLIGAAKAGDVSLGDIARSGGFGVLGMLASKKHRGDDELRFPMDERIRRDEDQQPLKKGGKVKKMAKGGSTASKRADGCATKGKTRGKFV